MKIPKFTIKHYSYILLLFLLISYQLGDTSRKVHPFVLNEITIIEIQ